MMTRKSKTAGLPVRPGASICLALDVKWFTGSLVLLIHLLEYMETRRTQHIPGQRRVLELE